MTVEKFLLRMQKYFYHETLFIMWHCHVILTWPKWKFLIDEGQIPIDTVWCIEWMWTKSRNHDLFIFLSFSHFYIFKIGLTIWIIPMEDHLQMQYFWGIYKSYDTRMTAIERWQWYHDQQWLVMMFRSAWFWSSSKLCTEPSTCTNVFTNTFFIFFPNLIKFFTL